MSIADRFFFERFNENHDPSNGQFSDGGGSSGSSSSTQASGSSSSGSGSGKGSGSGGKSGSGSVEQAQAAATSAAAGHAKLTGLPDKPIKLGTDYYVPGPIGKIQDAAAKYMKSAGLEYSPPTEYIKVDPERAKRVATAYDEMKHDPDDPAVKASYEALAKETLAQWKTIKDTGLKVEWIKPGQADPYADSPRRAAMDVSLNNHWWGFPTDLGYGSSDTPEHEDEKNPMLAETDEVIDGRKCVVNDIFRIVHDYFGHFKNGVGFRADGEDNAWRAHVSMFSDAAKGAMTSETRGQNSWVNFGPYGESNKTASGAGTHFAPQKIGLLPEWTWKGETTKASATKASDLFDQYHDASANADDIVKSVSGASAAVSAAETKLKDGTPTNAAASKGGFIQADGTYTPERQELHDRILNELFSSAAVKAATPAAGEKPVMTLLGGRGGSGKSWFTSSGVADAKHAVYINSDDLQAKLPGYEGWNAALYHDEAADITKRADDIARALGVNVIHDATMRTPGGSAKRAADYKSAGYAVHGHYMFLPPQTSTKRAMERFVRGGSTGRYVPASYLLNSTTNERSFDSLKGQLDKWSIYDNTGASPKLVAEGGTGEQEKRDARHPTRQIRERSRSAGGRRQPLFEGKPRQAEADDRTAQEGTTEEVARAPYRARAMSWFFERYNENHDSDTGQFASGGGGSGGGSSGSSTSSSSGKSAGKASSKSGGGSKNASKAAPAAAEKTAAEAGDKSDKRRAKLEDFQKANIQLDHTTSAHKENVDKFIDTWSERVGEEPEAFKKAFTGGVNVNMNIVASDPAKWSISGEVLDDKGARIGTYTREINWRTKTAESAYFALGRNATGQTATGHNIGKQMLAGNVETYQKLGLDAVKVHANIDVGGYAWAKYGYVPTAASWNELSANIRSKLRGGSGGPRVGAGGFDETYTPDSWDELSEDEQDTVKYQWMRDTKSDFIDSEISNWRDNGGALDQAKSDLAGMYDVDSSRPEWAIDAVEEVIAEREKNGSPVPYTSKQILAAASVSYENDGEGRSDPEISFDDSKLQEPSDHDPDQLDLPGIDKPEPHERLTSDMRDELTDRLTKAFNDKADSDQGDIEPPDYLSEQVDEYQEQHWDGMSERERYRWARDNGVLPQHEIENDDPDDIDPDDVEKDEGSDDTLMRLASSSNPKALWAIADSARGKELLLGSDWYGVLRLNDKDTMDRFNAYVGKKKAA